MNFLIKNISSKLNYFAIGLGLIALIASFFIVYVAYTNSVSRAEKNLYKFYTDKAQLIHSIILINEDKSEKEILQLIEHIYGLTENRPNDEYVCIVDKNSDLIMHSKHPNTVGNNVGNNQIFAPKIKNYTLNDLVLSHQNYIGDYISSSGQKQIAAFEHVGSHQWTIGVHRSKKQILEEVKLQYHWFIITFIIISGVLIPVSLALLFGASRISLKRKLEIEKNNQTQLKTHNIELTKAKETAQENEIKLKAIINQSTEGITVADMEGNYIIVNPAFCKLSGYSEEELLKLTVFDMKAKNQPQQSFYDSKKKMEGLPIRVNLQRKDGSEYLTEIIGTVIEFDNKKLVLGTIRDITEREKAEQELIETKNELSSSQKMAKLGSWELNLNTQTITLSTEHQELINEKPIKTSMQLFEYAEKYILKEDIAIIKNRYDYAVKNIENDNYFDSFEYRLETSDGQIKYLSIRTTYKTKGITIGVTQDITEQKIVNQKLSEQKILFETLFDTISDAIGKTTELFYADPKTYKKAGKERYDKDADKNKNSVYEANYKKKDGTIFPGETFGTKLYNDDGKWIGLFGIIRDITERKQTELALQENEEKFSKSFFNHPTPMLIINIKTGERLDMNNSYLKLIGYDYKEITEGNLFKNNFAFNQNRLNEIVSLIQKNGSISDEYFKIVKKSGEIITTLVSAAKLNIDDGNTIVASFLDISDREKTQIQLKENEEKFKKLSNLTFEGILIHEKGVAIDYNRSFAKMFDYNETELIGKNLIELIIPEKHHKIISDNITNEYAAPYEIEGVRKDGSRFPMEIEARFLETTNNKKIRVAAIRDITTRKQVEQALQIEKHNAKKYLDIAGVMLVSLNNRGEIMLINKKGLEILGYSYNEIINKNWFDLCVHKDIREEIKGVFKNLSTGKTKLAEYYENTIINKKGELRDIAFHNTVIKNKKSQITGVLFSGEDITERKQAEEKLKESEYLLRESQEVGIIGSYILDISKGRWKSSAVLDGIFGIDEKYLKDIAGWLAFIHPKDQAMMQDYFATNIMTNHEFFDKEYRIVKIDTKEERWVHGLGKLEFDDEGKLQKMIGTIQDITERKQTEKGLKVQSQRLFNILEGTNAGTWDWNIQTGELLLNERWAGIMGYTLKELKPIDINTWINNVYPDDLANTNSLINKHFNKETDYYDVVFRQTHKDGHLVWVNARGKVIEWTKEGKPLRISGIHLEITNLKKVEQELQMQNREYASLNEEYKAQNEELFVAKGIAEEKEELNRAITQAAADAIISINAKGLVTSWNRAAEKIFGYTVAEMMNSNLSKIIPPNYWEFHNTAIKKLRNNANEKIIDRKIEITAIRKDGTEFPVDLSLSGWKTNKQTYYTGIIRDITDRTRAEQLIYENSQMLILAKEKAEESERKHRTLAQNMPGMIYRANADWTTNIISNSKIISGYTVNDFLNNKVNWFNLIHPDDVDKITEQGKILLQKPRSIMQEYRIITKDESVKYVADYKTSLFTPSSKFDGIDGIVFDITDRKIAEIQQQERLKEFKGLYLFLKEAGTTVNLKEILSKLTAEIIPESMQFPDKVFSEISINKYLYSDCKNIAHKTDHYLKADIKFKSKKIGELHIGYIDKKTPFIKNYEQDLTNAYGVALSNIIESYDFYEKLVKAKEKAEKAKEKVIENEEKYRSLFENMMDAFALHKIVLDKNNKPVDYIFMEVNQAFESMTGLKTENIINKKVTEVIPGIENDPADWIGIYGKVALTGKEHRFEQFSDPLNRWYSILVFSPNKDHFAVIFSDITERKEMDKTMLDAIIKTEEKERSRIAKDLHDGLGPILSTIKLYNQWIQNPDKKTSHKFIFDKSTDAIEEAIKSVKEISANLSPHVLTNYGIVTAINSFIDKLNILDEIEIIFETNLTERIEKPIIETTLYRIFTECVNNTLKYAKADKIQVYLNKLESKIEMEYSDNGTGFDVNKELKKPKGLGLNNIISRIRTIDGTCDISSDKKSGTKISVKIELT